MVRADVFVEDVHRIAPQYVTLTTASGSSMHPTTLNVRSNLAYCTGLAGDPAPEPPCVEQRLCLPRLPTGPQAASAAALAHLSALRLGLQPYGRTARSSESPPPSRSGGAAASRQDLASHSSQVSLGHLTVSLRGTGGNRAA